MTPSERHSAWSKALAAAAAVVLVMTTAGPATAYVGPGAGLSLLGSLWWLLVAVLTAIGIVLYWPIRVLIRWIRLQIPTRTPPEPRETETPADSEEDDSESSPEPDDGADEDADDQRS